MLSREFKLDYVAGNNAVYFRLGGQGSGLCRHILTHSVKTEPGA